MWLKLDLNGMRVDLQINGYQSSNSEDWYDNWCNVDFFFKFPGCIEYSGMDEEILLSCEVEELESAIDDFINDRIKDREMLEMIEPDFQFGFIPGYDKVKAGESTYTAPGHGITDPIMEWKVKLWDGGLTDNYFSATLYKEDMRVLRDYLRLVICKLSKDSVEIKELVNVGVIGGQF